MSKKRTKQYLMLLMVIGLVSIAAGNSGTFASFSAETANTGNTFATGTLYLHDTVNNTCTSESTAGNSNVPSTAGNANPGDQCDVLFNLNHPDSGPHYVDLALKNAGSLDAKNIQLQLNGAGCASTTEYQSNAQLNGTLLHAGGAITTISLKAPGLTLALRNGEQVELQNVTNQTDTFTVDGTGPDHGVNGTFPVGSTTIDVTSATPVNDYADGDAFLSTPGFTGGGGGLCGNLNFTITETGPSFGTGGDASMDATTGDTSGGDKCVYGTQAGTDGNAGCTVDNAHNIGALGTKTPSNTWTPLNLYSQSGWNQPTGLDSGHTRYFVLVISPNVNNGDQSKKATFDMIWHIDQA